MGVEITNPEYGYMRRILLFRAIIYYNLYNEWVEKDLEALTYTDKYGRNGHGVAFICQEARCARRYHMKYEIGIVAKGDIWGI